MTDIRSLFPQRHAVRTGNELFVFLKFAAIGDELRFMIGDFAAELKRTPCRIVAICLGH
ncbi:MAG TPA: hypothetical protein VL492_00945 [Methylovirgula sp.]|nr:hypothetical protein [Methylovirgula sp.]